MPLWGLALMQELAIGVCRSIENKDYISCGQERKSNSS